ncbi:MAG TPA: IscS subfamily cysteine desulfurase [Terracidiphilus sp.]|nr:IscS subfamily cysteine desulfurase [Terracidiphilus sp.]
MSRAQSPIEVPEGVHLPIYMDNQATCPLDPRVLEAMMPFLTTRFGNAASRSHSFGWEAEQAVETAREQVAQLIGAAAWEIVFTSGATESNNLAIKGVAEANRKRGNHIVTQATEHKAVLDVRRRLEDFGFRVTCLPVKPDGLVDPEEVKRAVCAETILVSVMAANNEIGVLQPIRAIGRICREKGVLFHTDAAQAVGKVPMDVNADAIDMLSLSGHKMYGPKGVGALYVRRSGPRVAIVGRIDGGGHERGLRSGTLNVPGIVGLGKACAVAQEEMEEEGRRLRTLRDRLRAKIESGLEDVRVNGAIGPGEQRLPGNLNMSFPGVEAEALMMAVSDVALSSGSACTSASREPSHVLRALGLDDDTAHSSIRFGLGRFNTEAEVDYVAARVVSGVKKLRALAAQTGVVKTGMDLEPERVRGRG